MKYNPRKKLLEPKESLTQQRLKRYRQLPGGDLDIDLSNEPLDTTPPKTLKELGNMTIKKRGK